MIPSYWSILLVALRVDMNRALKYILFFLPIRAILASLILTGFSTFNFIYCMPSPTIVM